MSPLSTVMLFCTLAMIRGFPLRSTGPTTGHFVSVSHGPNKRDILVKLSGVTATESVAGFSQRYGVIVRRASDGRRLVQTLRDWNHQVRDCRISNDKREIVHFETATEARIDEHARGVAAVLPPSSPRDFSFVSRSVVVDSRNLTVRRLSASSYEDQTSEDFLHLLSLTDVQSALEACRLHQQRLEKEAIEPAKRAADTDTGTSTGTKRDIRSALMIPGTLWCGPGSDAESYHQLGQDGTADACCREHDHCPDYISRWSSKYGIFNFRLYALSHCDCDRRFNQCLRDAGTSKADVVADWYFNIFQLSCFELRYKPTCVEYQGWFSRDCRRSELVPYAEIGAVEPIAAQDRPGVNATLVSTSIVPATTDGDEDTRSSEQSSNFVSTGSNDGDQ